MGTVEEEISLMNIVQLVSWKHWKHKLGRQRFDAVEPLHVYRTGVGWEGYDSEATVAENMVNLFGDMPDVVIGYKPLDHIGFNKLPCLTVIQYNEIKPHKFVPEVEEADPDVVVFHHLNDWLKWRNTGLRSVHIPHVVDPEIFRDYGQEKIWDVIAVGAINEKIYPLRTVFIKAVQMLSDRGFRCMTLFHPGWSLLHADTREHLVRFARAINESHITCFCSSIYKYRLGKYVEVPACVSAVAADIPESEDDMSSFIIECRADEDPVVIADRLEQCLTDGVGLEVKAGVKYAESFTPDLYSQRIMKAIA